MRPMDLSSRRMYSTWRRHQPGFLVALLLLSVSMAGCGATTSHPTGGSDLVLRIDVGGGFVPVEYNLTQTPTFSLFGDGRVIVTGPMIEIWPQPAMPNLQQTIISQETMDKLLSAAKEAGLFANDVDYGIPGITDVATTTITINADGKSYESNIYALGFGETFEQDLGESASDLGLTPEQMEARSAVLGFTMKTGRSGELRRHHPRMAALRLHRSGHLQRGLRSGKPPVRRDRAAQPSGLAARRPCHPG